MRKISIFIPVIIILLSSCASQHEKVLRSKDVNYKLTKANEYYDQKKWYKANELYEILMPSMRGTKNYEELYYRYCYSFYNQKDYISASYQFKNFTENFPKSPRADECEFMHAVCLFKDSPKYPLDQSNTIKAMEALQTYVTTHPESKNLTEANNDIDICRAKIELKDSKAALLYYNLGQYKAASVAYKALIQAYPESKTLDLYQYMVIKAYYEYADASIKSKQEERFAEAVNAYTELVDYSPHSSYLKDAEKLYTASQNHIKQLRNEHK
ncbi:outer membrane protein assembly factor BamD [Taibaiella chishuiensis]|uniref:Beta-barrel assembly machine subunit BamD n=1 Tax=Taibaiella chishuiensis TaxID=1434707 RepID=A0A2P8CR58_9BACT|nr:outer membrane protein assembly factor BamD [Taibaiella chishuiensis]PSK87440.1 Beta-barrel assembly machine subunit BamD [Taibaiella chishuiensis]